nr:hypothetical protein [uncultured Methanoregula sp.]
MTIVHTSHPGHCGCVIRSIDACHAREKKNVSGSRRAAWFLGHGFY